MSKKYTLELTAEELEHYESVILEGRKVSLLHKLQAVAEQARADKEREEAERRAAAEAAELRLPWRAYSREYGWHTRPTRKADDFSCVGCCGGERAAKLASAAPELLEAVQAVANGIDSGLWYLGSDMVALIKRALRKVETGIPEESRASGSVGIPEEP